jgi:prepilin-type N-terminal cleavage/methylation domain-containing protein
MSEPLPLLHGSAVRRRDGFTLVEVLVSMVILAVGLLALEAVAVGAARMTVRADRQSEYAMAAANQMESVLETIGRGGDPGTGDRVSRADGSTVETVVTRAPVASGQSVYTVQVTVTAPSGRGWSLDPVTVVGRAFQQI